jgi:hypothetical protein
VHQAICDYWAIFDAPVESAATCLCCRRSCVRTSLVKNGLPDDSIARHGAQDWSTRVAVSRSGADQVAEPTGSSTDALFVDAVAARLAEAAFTPFTT